MPQSNIAHQKPSVKLGFCQYWEYFTHTLYLSTTSPYTRILLMIAKLEQVDLALKFVLP
ncbi:hypothetical protein LP090_00375 [Moraxella bovis]|uniref:hypothetical protein n=1 Tax=Moraxella bovis TaxID=476 RepID=UPI002226C752|nr:hypothetical protein [Moraxella bovis]UYZ70852.1 hypothetical protein LP089_12295 [Moraxella bovis]UYZ73220.1 hypothetical protein LP105_00350 [Moraxella bovis]UZA14161.1 hypothetical protein LP102_12390 [Moraxella bovis]UZA37981.1 hypothetical protein LP101_12710 [Moraxella bovis]UZA43109.1 hypothetical protein LP090_00375 [Moraxella bovis]